MFELIKIDQGAPENDSHVDVKVVFIEGRDEPFIVSKDHSQWRTCDKYFADREPSFKVPILRIEYWMYVRRS